MDFNKVLELLREESGKDEVIFYKDNGEDMEITLNSIGSRFGTLWRIKDIPSVPSSEYSYKDAWSSKEEALKAAKKLIKKFYKD